jgi:hypothetical protein
MASKRFWVKAMRSFNVWICGIDEDGLGSEQKLEEPRHPQKIEKFGN